MRSRKTDGLSVEMQSARGQKDYTQGTGTAQNNNQGHGNEKQAPQKKEDKLRKIQGQHGIRQSKKGPRKPS